MVELGSPRGCDPWIAARGQPAAVSFSGSSTPGTGTGDDLCHLPVRCVPNVAVFTGFARAGTDRVTAQFPGQLQRLVPVTHTNSTPVLGELPGVHILNTFPHLRRNFGPHPGVVRQQALQPGRGDLATLSELTSTGIPVMLVFIPIGITGNVRQVDPTTAATESGGGHRYRITVLVNHRHVG